MKPFIPLTLLASLAAIAPLSAQTPAFSKPSGYETINLAPGFNFVGMRLVESAILTGTFTANTATSLTDSTASFSLNANTLYLIEFGGNGPLKGLVLEAFGSSFSGNTISGLTGVTSDYLAPYTVRPAQTIGGLFGTGNNVLLQKGTVSTADTIFVTKPTGDGFDIFFHTADSQPFPGAPVTPGRWSKLGSSADQANTPINFIDGFYVQVRGSAKSLVVTGQVKTTSTLLPGVQGISYFSSIYPAGTTLASSGLASQVLKGTVNTADLIYMPIQGGGFDIFFHTADSQPFPGAPITAGKWTKVGSTADQGPTSITTGFIFLRRGPSQNLNFTPPAFFSNL